MKEITIFSGSAHAELAAAICHHLEVPLAPSRVTRFSNDCLEVQLMANCRERDVFVVQPLVPPVQEHLVELLLNWVIPIAVIWGLVKFTAAYPDHVTGREQTVPTPVQDHDRRT